MRRIPDRRATYLAASVAACGSALAGDPCGPVVIGEIQRQAGSTSWDVVTKGTTACLANFDGLYIVDVSDPSSPATLGFAPVGGIPTSVAMGNVYAAIGDNLFGVRMFDFRNPANPVQTAELDLRIDGFAGVAGVEIFQGRLYISSFSRGFSCYDIEQGGSLTPFSSYDGYAGSGKISVSGPRVFVTGQSPDLTILTSNLSGTGNVLLRGSYDQGPSSSALAATSWGDTCYLAMASGTVEFLDISDETDPQVVGSIALAGQPVDLEVWGTILYVTELGLSSSAPDRVLMFEVSDPTNPVQLGEIDIGNAYGIDFSGSTLFAAADHRGLVSINVSDLCLDCPVDFFPDNVYNFFDIYEFVNMLQAGDPAADLAAPFGVLNFFDVVEMIELYHLGCP